jgi:ribose transport system substrate-binding protein
MQLYDLLQIGVYDMKSPQGDNGKKQEVVGLRSNSRYAAIMLGVLVLALGLAACGGGGSSSSSTTETEATEAKAETGGETESTGEASGGDAVAAAEKVIAPYVGHPSAFPVTEKLDKLPKGANIDYMDCGTPVCALFWELLEPAGKTMGVNLKRVKAGSSANTVGPAFDTVVSEEPDGVIVAAIPPELWTKQLKELQAKEIPIASTGIVNAEEYGIVSPQFGKPETERDGKLLANYVAANEPPDSNVVIYEVPELNFTGVITSVFVEELESICPECRVRTAKIPVAELGSTAPNTVVSDLQSNPETSVAVFSTDEIQNGLPAALQAAGIEVATIGATATPTTLQYLKEGKETASLAVDLPVLIWTTLDQVAREIGGQEQTGDEAKGLTDVQFLTPEDITFDPSKGWTGYPEFAEMFAELWGVKG